MLRTFITPNNCLNSRRKDSQIVVKIKRNRKVISTKRSYEFAYSTRNMEGVPRS